MTADGAGDAAADDIDMMMLPLGGVTKKSVSFDAAMMCHVLVGECASKVHVLVGECPPYNI